MSDPTQREARRAALALVFNAFVWGTSWWPLRRLQEAGLHPLWATTIIFTVVVSTIGGLQLFTEPYLFEPSAQGSTGGSARQYQTVVMYLYEKAFAGTQFDFGYAAAIGWALFLLIAVISLINFLIVRRIRSAEA